MGKFSDVKGDNICENNQMRKGEMSQYTSHYH